MKNHLLNLLLLCSSVILCQNSFSVNSSSKVIAYYESIVKSDIRIPITKDTSYNSINSDQLISVPGAKYLTLEISVYFSIEGKENNKQIPISGTISTVVQKGGQKTEAELAAELDKETNNVLNTNLISLEKRNGNWFLVGKGKALEINPNSLSKNGSNKRISRKVASKANYILAKTDYKNIIKLSTEGIKGGRLEWRLPSGFKVDPNGEVYSGPIWENNFVRGARVRFASRKDRIHLPSGIKILKH